MKILIITLFFVSSSLFAQIKYFVQFKYNNQIQYGQINGDTIQPLKGSIFNNPIPKEKPIPLKGVELLIPTNPQKIFAVGMNFSSHLSSSSKAPPPMFTKLPTSLIASGKKIYLPKDATNVHFEGELVLIIGKKAKNIREDNVKDYILGVTVGNDLTERDWQNSDLQWIRSKGSDGFAPIGSKIAIGVDYNNLLLTTKLNGKIVQQENTRNMIHKPKKVISYLSRYFTLMPGDLIYMGTPGRTQSVSDGDKVSVTIEKVGTLINEIKEYKKDLNGEIRRNKN